ncbi:unnamed protein product [Nezara viridula]|uniref:Nose resistant-to-fluoxetine protein N-terminal domain-containing protein n=1 Tax=Nezara viridula TaxID=85310 RepID=A0A9P0MP25_NEZVI|nr:unnamed protein product [Nezara viridula]
MKPVFILLLFWIPYSTEGNENSYQAYYNEDFYSFVVGAHASQHNSVLQELFSNLMTYNSTDSCVRDLKNYQHSLNSHEKWAISLLDSSGIPATGLLSGNTISLGNYKQCLSTSPRNFSSSYCLVDLNISKKPIIYWAPHNVPIVFTLCLPGTCDNKQLERLLEPTGSVNNATVTVECQSTRPTFTFADIFVMFLFILIWIVIISTTIPKKWIRPNNKVLDEIRNSFSLRRNLSSLLRADTRSSHLASLYGLRALSQCVVVWCHVVLGGFVPKYPALNKFSYYEFLRSWEGALETEMSLTIDTFFVISGVLLTWNCLENRKKFNLLSYYTRRYLRLTPPYFAMILIISTFANKLCDGPLCSYLIDQEKDSCASYWWTNVLYINNFYPGVLHSCMPISWYLSTDWQLFFLVSPFVVIVINRWPRHLYKLITAIFLSSVISTFLVSYFYQIPTNHWMFNSFEDVNNYYQNMYAAAYMRAGPWAAGMLCGVFLHSFKNNPMELSKKVLIISWALTVLGLCLAIEFDLPFLRWKLNETGVWSALSNAIQHNLWAASICWIIFSSGTQKAGFVGIFLCWPGFQPLAKISYSAYLVHKVIISLYFGETSGYRYISATNQAQADRVLFLMNIL